MIIHRNSNINTNRSSCTVPVILVKFQRKLDFLDKFSHKASHLKLNENQPSRSRGVPRGHSDMIKLKVAFRNSVNGPTNAFLKSPITYFRLSLNLNNSL